MSRRKSLSAILVTFFLAAALLVNGTPSVHQFEQATNSLIVHVENGPQGLRVIDVVDNLKVSVEDLPEHLRDALLTMEDRRFQDHPGVDWRAILRAIVAQTVHGRREGGSTLTQQLAKNVFLSNEPSLSRKLREMVLAFKLEWHYEKDEILNVYLNQIYFGERAYGIEAASRVYFRKSAKDLNLYESALLVGSIPSPSRWNPVANPKKARARARLVLDRMVDQGHITQREAKRVIVRGVRKGQRRFHRIESRFFTDWLRPQVEIVLNGREGRFALFTNLNSELQVYAERAVARGLAAARHKRVSQAALVALDPNGAVLAMVGSRDYAENSYNRAAQASRQPGSAFKPIAYLAALENGWEPEQRIQDRPIRIDGWSPRNIDGRYLGPIPLKSALAQSRNAATVRLSSRLDRADIIETARRLGITGRLPDDPSLVLGTGEVTLLELVNAYVSFANGGYKVRPFGIVGVRDSSGDVLYWNRSAPSSRVVSSAHVGAMNAMLKGVMAPGGTGARAAINGHSVAGKTGTTQGYGDAWIVGYSSHLVSGVWMGNDDNGSMAGVTGGSYPADIWRDFMGAAHRYMHLEPGPLPGDDGAPVPDGFLSGALRYVQNFGD